VSALLYYTHNAKPRAFMEPFYRRHRELAAALGHQWIAVVREPFGDDDTRLDPQDGDPKYADIYRRILAGLDRVAGPDDTMVYLIEDDVIYCRDHFDQPPRGLQVFYNLNLAYMCSGGYYWHLKGAIALSQLCGSLAAMRLAFRTKLLECLERRLACVEPAGKGYVTGTFHTHIPNLDIRSGYNATWRTPEGAVMLQTMPGWKPWADMWARYGGGLGQ